MPPPGIKELLQGTGRRTAATQRGPARDFSAPCPLYFSGESEYTVIADSYCGGERIRRGWRKYGKRAEVPSTS